MQAIDVVRRLGVRVAHIVRSAMRPRSWIRRAWAASQSSTIIGLWGSSLIATWYGADLPRTLHLPPRSSR